MVGILTSVTFLGLDSCSRKEPESTIIALPPVSATFTQIAVFNTAVPEPSGLAYNAKNNSLMTVSDGNSTVYELNVQGVVLKTIVVQGSDLEGIALSAGCDTMYLAEEGNQQISTYLMDGTKIRSLRIPVATVSNNGLEGVTIDPQGRLIVVNEKNPRLLLEYSGTTEQSRFEITTALDLSDVSYDAAENQLWVISDESMKLQRYSRAYVLLNEYALPFSKGEGVAVVGDKIYVVNDATGKMFVFTKPL